MTSMAVTTQFGFFSRMRDACVYVRYTNDPSRDPELSGSTVDRADPTSGGKWVLGRLSTHALFLSGYPFGFERFGNMVAHATVSNVHDRVSHSQRSSCCTLHLSNSYNVFAHVVRLNSFISIKYPLLYI